MSILDAQGREYKFGEKEIPRMGETAAATPVSRLFANIYPYNPDDLVGRQGLEVYQGMVKEPFVKMGLLQKKTGLLKAEFEIEAASDSPEDQAVAEFIRWNIGSDGPLEGPFVRDLYEMLDALDCGFSVMEKIWGRQEDGEYKGKIYLKNLKSKDPRFFDFKVDKYGNLYPDGLILKKGSMAAREPLEVNKFVIYSHLMRYENFYGTSDLRAAYRAYWVKDTAWKLRAVYMERFAGSHLKGTYPAKDKAAKEALLETFRTWQQTTGIAIPSSAEVEVIKMATASPSEYEASIKDCNVEIQIGIVGQTLTMETGKGGNGSRALGQVHNSIKNDLIWLVDLSLAAEVNLQIVRPLVDYNFMVWKYPRFRFKNREGLDEEKFSRTAQNLGEIPGLKVPVSWVKDRLKIPTPKEGEELIGSSAAAAEVPSKSTKEDPPLLLAEPKSPESAPPAPGILEATYIKIERRSALPSIDRDIDALVAKIKEAAGPVFKEIQEHILKRVKKTGLIEAADYSLIPKIDVNVGGLKEIFSEVLLEARTLGRLSAVKFIPETETKLAEEDNGDMKAIVIPVALLVLAKKAKIPRRELKSLAREMEGKAITIAGIEGAEIDKEVKRLLYKVMKNKEDINAFAFYLSEMFIKYAPPEYAVIGKVAKAALDFQLETIARTVVMEVFNEGRQELLEDPGVLSAYPAWMISEVLDGKTRPSHYAAGSKRLVFMATDPIWRKISPPNGYNCRGVIAPISKFIFTREMLSSPGDIPADYPDSGFGG